MRDPDEQNRTAPLDKRKPPGSLVKAVVVGMAIILGGTLAVAFGSAVIYAAVLLGQGRTPEQIQRAMEGLVPWSGFGLVPSLLGCIVSVLAGYHCAAIANRKNYLAPGILSVLSVTCGAYAGGTRAAVWILSVFSAITVVVTLTGAWLCMRRTAHAS